MGLVIEWAAQHTEELLNNWELAKKNLTPNKIEVTFKDGATGVVDFSKYLSKGGVFEKFKDIEFFKNFKIHDELGVLTWGDEVDIAPETLYAEATNSPLPDWMDSKKDSSANMSLQQTS